MSLLLNLLPSQNKWYVTYVITNQLQVRSEATEQFSILRRQHIQGTGMRDKTSKKIDECIRYECIHGHAQTGCSPGSARVTETSSCLPTPASVGRRGVCARVKTTERNTEKNDSGFRFLSRDCGQARGQAIDARVGGVPGGTRTVTVDSDTQAVAGLAVAPILADMTGAWDCRRRATRRHDRSNVHLCCYAPAGPRRSLCPIENPGTWVD